MEVWARPMVMDDVPDAQRLLKYAAQGQAAIFQLSEAEASQLLRAAASGTDGCGGAVAIALDEDGDEVVVGAVTWQAPMPSSDSSKQGAEQAWVLLTISVRADLRRGGMARQLLQQCTTAAAAAGCRSIVTDVSVANAAGCAFFQACGFKGGKQTGSTREFTLQVAPAATRPAAGSNTAASPTAPATGHCSAYLQSTRHVAHRHRQQAVRQGTRQPPLLIRHVSRCQGILSCRRLGL